jgi:hypothetical protein
MEEGIPGKQTSELEFDPVARRANLKFPPRESGLKIPRSLFLTTPSSSPSYASSSSKGKKGDEEDEITPKAQAEEMAKLMRRSVLLHEFKERKLWDEDLDPYSASEDRVQVLELSPNADEGVGNEEEERVVREWIEDCLR